MVSSDVVFLGFASPRSPSNVSLLVGRRDGGGGGGRAQSENLEKYLFRKLFGNLIKLRFAVGCRVCWRISVSLRS